MSPLFHRSSRDAAFERLYRHHVKDVYRYAFALLGEAADAEDVTQTTFLNAYRAFQQGERPSKPENWLITIAHNVCRQRFRQAQRRPKQVEFLDSVAEARVDEPAVPQLADVRRAFAQLRPNQREALVLRELEGRSYAEIAKILEITPSALETLLFRARRALREQLDEHLTCEQAAFAISKEEDGRLAPDEQRALRAHVRSCPECATAAKRQRALRGAFKRLVVVPLPASLGSFSGWSAAGVGASGAGLGSAAFGGAGIAFKAATLLAAGALVGGGAYVGVTHHAHARHQQRPATTPSLTPAAPLLGRASVAPPFVRGHAKPAHARTHLHKTKAPKRRAKHAQAAHAKKKAKPAVRDPQKHPVKRPKARGHGATH